MNIQVKDQLVGLKPYQPGKTIDELKRELGLEQVIKLASNENPFGCSDKAKQALKESVDELAIYPDGYALDLRLKLARFLGVNKEQLMFGSGSDEIILMISRALLAKGDNTVMAKPTFPQYRHHAIIEGVEYREVENINGEHNLDGILKAIDERTRIVWLCTPNNPTGTYINEEQLHDFMSQVPKEVLVVIDEAYKEYVVAKDYPDTISMLDQFENILILRTFSKAYGLAALRIGYAIGPETLMEAMDPVRPPFNTSRIAQKAAIAALEDQDFIDEIRQDNRKGLQQYYDFCEKYGLSYFPSQTNFILINFNRPGDEVFQYLLKKGFIVRSGEALGYPTSVRITIGRYEENEAIIETLSQWLDQHK